MEKDDEIKDLKRRIEELTSQRDEQQELIGEMREHLEDSKSLIGQWIDAFSMTLADDGKWTWTPWIESQKERDQKYSELLRKWNKFVPQYNAVVAPRRRNFGRPLAASHSQCDEVLRLHDSGLSLRNIATHTTLGMRTVRTIIDKRHGVDRATLARLEKIAPDRMAEARRRAGRKAREALPGRIKAIHAETDGLIKKAKGLG